MAGSQGYDHYNGETKGQNGKFNGNRFDKGGYRECKPGDEIILNVMILESLWVYGIALLSCVREYFLNGIWIPNMI